MVSSLMEKKTYFNGILAFFTFFDTFYPLTPQISFNCAKDFPPNVIIYFDPKVTWSRVTSLCG